jgi:uncharacterized protein Smg (DUF494 family)
MMNKRTLEVLTFIMKEIRENSFDDIDLQFIMGVLIEKGFSEEEIRAAMLWLMNHGDNFDRSYQRQTSGIPRPIWRHLTDLESSAISASAFSYLFHLRELNLLSDDEMEAIIERAVRLQIPQMEIEDLQDLITAVVLDVETSASDGYFQFTSTRLPH